MSITGRRMAPAVTAPWFPFILPDLKKPSPDLFKDTQLYITHAYVYFETTLLLISHLRFLQEKTLPHPKTDTIKKTKKKQQYLMNNSSTTYPILTFSLGSALLKLLTPSEQSVEEDRFAKIKKRPKCHGIYCYRWIRPFIHWRWRNGRQGKNWCRSHWNFCLLSNYSEREELYIYTYIYIYIYMFHDSGHDH